LKDEDVDSEEDQEEVQETGELESEEIWSETCNHITFIEDLEDKEDCLDKGESCLAIHFGSDSEEELCFPEEPKEEPSKKPVGTEDECLMNLRQGKVLLPTK